MFISNLQQYIKTGGQHSHPPQPFSVALQMHEVALENIFQLTVVLQAQLPSALPNKLHCSSSDEGTNIRMIS